MNLIFSISFSYIILLIPGIPFYIGLTLTLVSIFIWSYKQPDVSLIPISFMMSSYQLIRYKSPDSIVLAGFRTEIIITFIIGYLIRELFLKKSKFKIPNESWLYFFLLWSLICFSLNSKIGIFGIFLAVRENIEVWFLFPFIVVILRKNLRLLGSILIALCLGSTFVSIINIAHYFAYISLPYDQYAIRRLENGNSYIHTRVYLGLIINRMNPLFGIGPGGGGLYYTSLGICSFLCSIYIAKKRYLKLVLLISSCILFIASFLTASITILATFILAILARFIIIKNTELKIISFPFIIVCSIAIITNFSLLGIELGHASPIEYFKEGFIGKAITDLQSYNISEILFGKGLGLRTGLQSNNINLKDVHSIDSSWIILSNKTGIIGLIVALYFVFTNLYKFISMKIEPLFKGYQITAGCLLFALLSYVHSSPMIVRPLDYGFMISIAGISVIEKKTKYKSITLPSKKMYSQF